MAPRAVLLDLDGTVWDSYPWYAAHLGTGPAVAEFERRLRRGENVVRLAQSELGRARFLGRCRSSSLELRLYPGVRETIDELRLRGVRLGVVTSLPRDILALALPRAGLEGRFESIVDASCRPYKPSSRPLLRALEEMGLQSSPDIFYVGDQPTDSMAAHAAGVAFAWAAYGYCREEAPPAEAVLESFMDLLTL